eukprot:CAMPEP_0198666314 /NCGR_PEP_ID=MMETSP1467-20131203/64192_1 /TAXON_ID=1462469 /ORGANISM="unid. sp., Strain CCMP2135" /LENGTH=236 /DNA_ID=CAMNT_0044402955 /DNA_START=10 /DNA_END=720 /DNA_ORIENTATION=-
MGSPHARSVLEGKVVYVAAGAMLVLLVMSMSIRHAVVCESGSLADESGAGTQLGRQALEARLLNVEQEAMENSLLIEKVLRLLRDEFDSREKTSEFAAAYSDAERLAVEIDAAFDSVDANIFALPGERADTAVVEDAAVAEEDPQRGGGEDPLGEYDDDDDDADALRRGQPQPALDYTEWQRPPPPPRDAAMNDSQRCAHLARTYSILPQVSWGTAPVDVQHEWRTLNCDQAPGLA